VAKFNKLGVNLVVETYKADYTCLQRTLVYWIALCYHPYFVSLLFAILLPLHLI